VDVYSANEVLVPETAMVVRWVGLARRTGVCVSFFNLVIAQTYHHRKE